MINPVLENSSPQKAVRAAEGQKMWVLLNHIKADRCAQFERFVHDILMSAGEKVDPAAFRHTRFLHPAEQNEDGTYTSVFLMDPLIKGADYNILNLLKKAYSEDKAEEYYQLWIDSLASPQTGYEVTQSAL